MRITVALHVVAFTVLTAVSAPCVEAQTPAPPVRLEYRWLSEGVGGLSQVLFDVTGEPVALSDSVALTLEGVARADVVPTGPGGAGWDVIVRLTPAATATFADITAAHIGHRLAVVLDGRLVQVVSIGGRLGRIAGVVADVPRDTADAVAARLNGARQAASGH